MRSLYVKIFLTFLVTIFLVILAAVILTVIRDREFALLPHQDFVRKAITEYSRQMIHAYEHDGIEAADKISHELERQSSIHISLFDEKGRPLTHRRVGRHMERMAQQALRTGEVVFPKMGVRNRLASVIQMPSGRTYVVGVRLPNRPPAAGFVRSITHGFLGWQLLLLLGVAALACFFLARSLTSPISRLRQATRSFAAGDLSTRIGDGIKGSNEIAGLAGDFDDMAAKIEDLVDAQQCLLRDISHELRSPLARLGIALELARQEEDPVQRDKSLLRIERETERMNEMIGALLRLTRLDSGSDELQKEEFDLAELLDSLVQDANYEAEARSCQVVLTAPSDISYVGSQELLASAVENVIRNAVRHAPEKSCVTVDLSEENRQRVIRVVDQGPGVPEVALGKLFKPFYRVESARDRQSGGTGIGLAIAERAVSLHGGSIRAENRPVGGLVVEIRLPV